MADSHSNQYFPLTEAEQFCRENSFGDHFEWIRSEITKSRLREIGLSENNTSSTRRGMVIVLLETKGLLREFIEEYWQRGKTTHGETQITKNKRDALNYIEETSTNLPWDSLWAEFVQHAKVYESTGKLEEEEIAYKVEIAEELVQKPEEQCFMARTTGRKY